MREIAKSWAINYITGELNKIFKNLERRSKQNKYFKFTYKPNRGTSFINNPIGQIETWALDITCKSCETRYSVIGAAYFCSSCGLNPINMIMDDSLNRI